MRCAQQFIEVSLEREDERGEGLMGGMQLFDTDLVTIPPVERRVPWFVGEGEGEVV